MTVDRSPSIHSKGGLAGIILESQRSQKVADSQRAELIGFGVLQDPQRAAAIRKWRGQQDGANPEQREESKATRWIL